MQDKGPKPSIIARFAAFCGGHKILTTVAAVILLLIVLFSTHIICFHTSTSPATCTSPETCDYCGRGIGEPLGHDTWTEATCTEPQTCPRCGETKGAPLGHTWKDATCTDPKTCTRCGQTEGEPLGHKPKKEWTIAKPATCEKVGLKTNVCEVCDADLKEEIPLAKHTPGEWKVTKEPKVEVDWMGNLSSTPGKKAQKCTVCGKTLKTKEYKLSKGELKSAYKSGCKEFTYDKAARNPDKYSGSKRTFSGKVVQVMQSGNSYTLRVNKGGDYDSTVYVNYTAPDSSNRILEDDWITLWGTLEGTKTYETIFGASITIPYFDAVYVER